MFNRKKRVCKVGIFCLVGVLMAEVAGGTVYAKNTMTEKQNIQIKEKINDAVDTIWKPTEESSNQTEETVYVLLDGNGVTQKTMVSDGERVEVLNDNGKEVPIQIRASYTLDGEETSVEELAGKSGHVVIRYDYTNHLYEERIIAGKDKHIYVPFAVLTGMILENEKFENVCISSGKVLDDGDRCIVTGITFPGLSENLEIDKLPDSLELEADVTDFSMGSVYCVATNSLFQNLNLEDADDFDDLADALNDLNDASIQLQGGSADLYDGVAKLYDKSGELQDGVKELADGAGKLWSGANQLVDGAGKLHDGAGELSGGANTLAQGMTGLQSGASNLSAGLQELATKNGELTGAAGQVFDTLLETANAQLNANEQLQKMGISANMTRDNYDAFLNGLLESFGAGNVRSQVEAQVKAKEAEIRAGVTAVVEAQVRTQAIGEMQKAGYPITEELYNTFKKGEITLSDAVSGGDAVSMQEQLAQLVAVVDQTVAAQMVTEQIAQIIEQNVAAKEQELINANLATVIDAANAGATQIAGLKTSLDSYNSFYQGLLLYTAGVSSASEGATQIAAGATQLSAGASKLAGGLGDLTGGSNTLLKGTKDLAKGTGELTDGMNMLSEGSDALIDGVSQLKDGAMELRDGLVTFDEEGISKITDIDADGIQEFIDTLKAIAEVDGAYHSFTGNTDDSVGSVKFIYKFAEIES